MQRSGRSVLVTGGAGFIGSSLVRRLLETGYSVRVLDNFATGLRDNLVDVASEVDLVEGDIQSYERVHNAVRGCEIVFHLAALCSVPRSIQDPLTTNAVNVIGTLNVLLAARDEQVRRVVFSSSSSIYGANAELPNREDQPTLPIAPYAVAKLAAEGYCRAFSNVYEIETVALRYFNVFGPRQDPASQYAAVIPKFITAFLDGEQPTIHGNGEQSRDFTYVDNAVDANLLAVAAPEASGRIFNIACGEGHTLNFLASEIRRLTNATIEPIHGPPRPGDIPHSLADVTAAREVLGYEPKVDLIEGLRRTVAWHEAGRAEYAGSPGTP
jgi:nucleoside-diphosphate-sugar epimerase